MTARKLKVILALAVALAAAAVLFVAAAVFLKGCSQQHYRGSGHQDVTFDISAKGDQMVFNGVGQGGRDLYLLDLKTWRVTRVARTAEYEVDPAFSPNGKTLVYAAGTPGDRADHLFVRPLNPRGAPHQLTAGDVSDASPSFLPDGSWIVFARARRYLFGGLMNGVWEGWSTWSLKPDGTGLRRENGKGRVFGNPPRSLSYGEFVLAPLPPSFAISHARVKQTLAPMPDVYFKDWTRPITLPRTSRILFLVEVWQEGPSGVSKKELWQVEQSGLKPPQRVASSRLFDDPLGWTP